MDPKKRAEGGQNVDSKPEKLLHVAQKSSILSTSPEKCELFGKHNFETKFASQTPEKTNQPLITKSKDEEFELLQRHKTMVEVFDSMCCSLRLLDLRKKPSTFENIRAQLEVLTKRRFSYEHVARIKYLLPEAIEIDKILVLEKKTLCMKPDMTIILLFDVIEGHHEHSNFIALHQLFVSRLINYFTEYPEACDIPEAILPDPFNQSKATTSRHRVSDTPEVIFPDCLSQVNQTNFSEQLLSNVSLQDLPTTTESEWLPKFSHMPPTFSRQFSEKIVSERETAQLLASPVPVSSVECYNSRNLDTKTMKARESSDVSPKFNIGTNLEQEKESLGIYSESNSTHPLPTLPVSLQVSINTNTCESPLLKHVSPANYTVVETPAQSIPKRIVPSSDDNYKGTTSQMQASSYKPAKRSLDFSFLDGDESECCELLPNNAQILDASSSLLQKAVEGLDCAAEEHRMSQSNLMHQQNSIDLPGLVSIIHHIFQSISYSPITKEELVHKIIIKNFDFVERSQVEEQIEILEKLVPDWICRKLAPSGDALYSIKKVSDLNSLQSRVGCI